MQVFYNVGGVTWATPGQTLYWTYSWDIPLSEDAGFDGNMGMCIASPQLVFVPWHQINGWINGVLRVTEQGVEETDNNPYPNYGNSILVYHVAIQADPSNVDYPRYQLQIVSFN